MSRRLPTAALIACLGVGVAAAPAGAATAKHHPRSRGAATYKVTFHATMKEQWSYAEDYRDDCELTGDYCTRTTRGSGTASVVLDTPTPQTCLTVRGAGGRPPGLCLGEGQPRVRGEYLRQGSLTTDYAGPWDAANPDRTAPADGCGRKPLRDEVSIAWSGRHEVHPSLSIEDPHGDCPVGPPESITWQGGEEPSLMDVEASASPGKFLGTKQFTVGGARTWNGSWGPYGSGDYSYQGTKKVTWEWSATFRLAGAKRHHRHR